MARKTTEEKIENAALSLFAQSGYKGTSTRKMAQVAGVSELTIYRCYKTKEDLFRQSLLNRMPNEWLGVIDMKPNWTLEDCLRSLFDQLYHTLLERQDLIQIFYREGASSSQIVDLARQVPPKMWGPIKDHILKACPDILPEIASQVAFQTFTSYLGICLITFTFGPDIIPVPIHEYHESMIKTQAQRLKETGCGQHTPF